AAGTRTSAACDAWLDADEVLVEECRDVVLLEDFPLHDVAPVARRVADGEEDRLVLGARARQRLWAPGIPIHRVVNVLAQVEGALSDEVVALPADHFRRPPDRRCRWRRGIAPARGEEHAEGERSDGQRVHLRKSSVISPAVDM